MALRRPRAALLSLAATLIALLAQPVAAQAATAFVEGSVLRVTAAPGEANQLAIVSAAAPAPGDPAPGSPAPGDPAPGGPGPGDPAPGDPAPGDPAPGDPAPGDPAPPPPGAVHLAVADAGAPLAAGPGCVRTDFGVTCVIAAAPRIDVSAGDLDDSVTIGVSVPARVDGGDGDDRLTGGRGPDVLLGGTGADFADGDSGNDVIEARDRLSDSAWCGRGRDSVRAEVLDFLDTACERVDYGRAGAVGRLAARTGGGRWVPIPGQTWARVDRRILPGVLWMIRRYHVRITEGYAVSGHTRFGEHPLGLAVDIEPGPGGTWADVARLARWAEPRQNRPRFPFRWVGWNGDANHGHPAICRPPRCAPHLHLSWSHTPTRPLRLARTVWVFEVR